MLHFMAGGVGFLGLIIATVTFTLRFARTKQWGRATASLLTGVFFTYAFMGIASGPPDATTMITFYLAVLCAWMWIIALSIWLARDLGPHPAVTHSTAP